MKNKIVITSDSTTDLSKELIERYNIIVLPLGITLGGKSYSDAVDITPEMIYEHHDKTGELPKTSACNIEQYTEFFKEALNHGDTVIHFSLSSEMSSTYNNSRIAAEEIGNVYSVDTKNLSTGGGLLVVAAAEMADKGMDAEKIVEEINKLVPCVDASFVIDSLEYLHEGGRCSAVALFGANLLKIKPCIEVKNGVMSVGKKYRGKYENVTLEYVKERLSDLESISPDRIFITHAGCNKDTMDEILKYVKGLNYFKEIFFTKAGATISSHCGQNTMGVLFIRKSPIA